MFYSMWNVDIDQCGKASNAGCTILMLWLILNNGQEKKLPCREKLLDL